MIKTGTTSNAKIMVLVLASAWIIGLQSNCFGQETAADKTDSESLPIQKQESGHQSADVHNLRPAHGTEKLLTLADKAIQQGLDFLIANQNDDGSWGSHDPKIASLANFGFQLRDRGAQNAVRAACTAICAQALLMQPDRTQQQQKALDSAIEDLLEPRDYEFYPGESFDTWGNGYQLEFLVELNAATEGETHQKDIKKAAQKCVDNLLKSQQHNGGWHYYQHGAMNQAGSMSFNTSLFALSLARAKKMGVDVPKGMVTDAAKVVDRQRVPDGSFHYDSRFFNSGTSALANLGSGSRTIANTYAMFQLGHFSQDDLQHGMKVFENGENYLEMGRKRITPHSVVHQISGYFFFFGYNYATQTAELLGYGVTQKRWDRLAWQMLRTQEDDGRWWDTAAADYGDKWGTGFALQSLQRYVRETRRRIEED